MSHVHAYGEQCPKAKPIIHLGATSCYVGDNTDIILMSEALEIVRKKLINVIAELAKFADEHKNLPTLAFTHFQPAQPTTVGKRATLWMQEFMMDLEDLEYVKGSLKLLGSKGTTGTQASFLELFDGDQETIDKIDPMIAKKMGFETCYPVSGQTYSRKVDTRVVNVLAGIAASAHKMSNDIRLLQHLLTRNKFRQHQNTRIPTLCLLHGKHLINFLVRARVCTITCELIFEDQPCYPDSMQEFPGQSTLLLPSGQLTFVIYLLVLGIPYRIKIANQ